MPGIIYTHNVRAALVMFHFELYMSDSEFIILDNPQVQVFILYKTRRIKYCGNDLWNDVMVPNMML